MKRNDEIEFYADNKLVEQEPIPEKNPAATKIGHFCAYIFAGCLMALLVSVTVKAILLMF